MLKPNHLSGSTVFPRMSSHPYSLNPERCSPSALSPAFCLPMPRPNERKKRSPEFSTHSQAAPKLPALCAGRRLYRNRRCKALLLPWASCRSRSLKQRLVQRFVKHPLFMVLKELNQGIGFQKQSLPVVPFHEIVLSHNVPVYQLQNRTVRYRNGSIQSN